jgi:membrane protein implicated in regulation of membrane protease activity
MQAVLNIAGMLLLVFGVIWFLQGINMLPGSFMTGQIKWAVYGGIAAVAGIALLVVAAMRRPKRQRKPS